jgi:hypothetical protein
VNRLQNQKNQKDEQILILQNKDIKEMWIEDINEFLECLEKITKKEQKLIEEQNRKMKKYKKNQPQKKKKRRKKKKSNQTSVISKLSKKVNNQKALKNGIKKIEMKKPKSVKSQRNAQKKKGERKKKRTNKEIENSIQSEQPLNKKKVSKNQAQMGDFFKELNKMAGRDVNDDSVMKFMNPGNKLKKSKSRREINIDNMLQNNRRKKVWNDSSDSDFDIESD